MGEEESEHGSEEHQGIEKSATNANHSGTTGLLANETGRTRWQTGRVWIDAERSREMTGLGTVGHQVQSHAHPAVEPAKG